MRIVLTGANGFIGGYVLQRLLDKGHDVIAHDRDQPGPRADGLLRDHADRIVWRSGDIADVEAMNAMLADADGVIHLAGALGPVCEADPAKAAQINFAAALSIFQQARSAPLKIVYASTAGIFSETDGMHPDPGSHYGVFKRALELSAQVFYQADGISSVGLRPLTVYGPGRLYGHSAGPSLACRAAARGEAYGHPFSGLTDFLFVEDLASAFVSALRIDEPGAHRLNVTGQVATVDDFLSVLRKQRPAARITCDGPSLPIAAYRPDNGFRRLLPDWRATSIEEGISRTLAVYEAQWQAEQAMEAGTRTGAATSA